MTNLQDAWSRQPAPKLSEKIGDTVRPQGPLKPRIRTTLTAVNKQVAHLDAFLKKLHERDEKLFRKVVAATQQHDAHASRVLSGELAEVRKVTKVLGNMRISLEQIELRLSTCNDIGDTVMTILPMVGLMRGIQSSLTKFMPGADQEISRMTETLGGLVTETFSGDAAFGAETGGSEEADSILQEAAAVAESAVDGKLPSTPLDLGEQQKAGESSQGRFT